ncbi:MAG: hypothetical protein UW66_C0038G0010, partial [Candidatus Moranbacteria bacterium GW2011_GWF1_44_4]
NAVDYGEGYLRTSATYLRRIKIKLGLVNNAILHETGNCDDWVVQDCVFNYGVGLGLDEAVIAGGALLTTGGTFDNNIVIGFDVLICDFNSSTSAQGDGIISNVRAVAGAALYFVLLWVFRAVSTNEVLSLISRKGPEMREYEPLA